MRARTSDSMKPWLTTRTLTDGGQSAADVAAWIAEFVDGAHHSLDLAQYDFHLDGDAPGAGRAADRDAARRGQGGRGRSRPDAPQVRDPRRRERVDRLDELDRRLVHPAGERDRDRRVSRDRGRLRRGLRADLGARRGGGDGLRRRRVARRRPRMVYARARRGSLAPDREADRLRDAACPDLLAGD